MKQLTRYVGKLNFGKKTSMPDSTKISTREVESSTNSISHHYQNISCRTGIPKTILRVSKYGRFFEVPYKFIIDQFFKDLTHNRKKGTEDNSFFCLLISLQHFSLISLQETQTKFSINKENKTPSKID